MLRTLPCMICLLTLAACSSDVPGADDPSESPSNDYPQFRGPNRTGLSSDKGLLKSWPEDGPKVAWKSTGLGVGFSSVAIADDKIFTMGDHRGKCRLFALNRDNGKQLWQIEIGRTGGSYSGPRSTPTVNGDYVYALGQFGDLVCADVSNGKEVWRKNFKDDFQGRYGGWQYAESPLVDGDQLICTPGGPQATMVALNKKTGKVIWKCAVPGEGAGYSSPVVSEAGKVRQYVQLCANSAIGVRAKDGKLLWRWGNESNRFRGNTANIPTCITVGDFVFCAAGYGRGGGLIKLSRNGDRFTFKERYFSNSMANKHGGVILAGKYYLFGDRDDSGRPWCADIRTGKILWQKRQRTKGSGSASITYADGHLYIRYQNGYVSLVKASKEGYDEISTFKVENGNRNCWAHPVVVGGKLYIREQDTLWCHDIKAGS